MNTHAITTIALCVVDLFLLFIYLDVAFPTISKLQQLHFAVFLISLDISSIFFKTILCKYKIKLELRKSPGN